MGLKEKVTTAWFNSLQHRQSPRYIQTDPCQTKANSYPEARGCVLAPLIQGALLQGAMAVLQQRSGGVFWAAYFKPSPATFTWARLHVERLPEVHCKEG